MKKKAVNTRKISLLFLSACLVALLSLLFFYVCVPRGESSVTAQHGVLDLSGQDFETLLFPLRGEWAFYFGSLHTPEDFSNGVPEPSYINAPSSWTAHGYPRYGAATYRLVLSVGEDRLLALSIPDVAGAARVFVNGDELFTRGVVSETSEAYKQGFAIATVFFQTENGMAEIIVQAANYNTPDSGMIALFRVEDANRHFIRSMSVWIPAALLMGCIIMMGLYHLILWLLHRQGGINLAFSLLCFACVGRFLMETNGLGSYVLPDWHGLLLFNVYVALFALHMFAVTSFSLLAFAPMLWKKVRGYLFPYYVITLTAALLLPTDFPGEYKYHFFTAPMLFTLIAAGKRVFTQKKGTSILYFIGLALYLFAGSYASLFLVPPLFIPNLMIDIFMVLSQSIILSYDYARAQDEALEARASEQKLADENAMLDRMNRMKTDLMATISHETRTPLAVLSGYAELISMEMREKGVDAQTIKDLDNIADETQRIARLMEEIQKLLKEKSLPAGKSRLDLGELVESAARLYRPILARNNTTLETGICDDLPCVYANAGEVTQVLFNLLQNARNHTENGTVTIRVQWANHEMAEVIVRDTGTGIAPELLPRIFERGVTGDENGNGIGLAICKDIISGHGGRIEIGNRLEGGTEARFTLSVLREDGDGHVANGLIG